MVFFVLNLNMNYLPIAFRRVNSSEQSRRIDFLKTTDGC